MPNNKLKLNNPKILKKVIIAIIPGLIVAGFWAFAQIASPSQRLVFDALLPGKIIINPSLPGKAIITGQTITAPPEEPGFCAQEGDKNSTTTINGDVVYCDNSLRMWTPTADVTGTVQTYVWGGYGIDEPTDSCIGVANRPACNYCDNLTHAGYSDWELPSCVSGTQNSNCILYQFGIDACGGYSCTPGWDTNAQTDFYWSSTESDSLYACLVDFDSGHVDNFDKVNDYYVRCVRGQ